MKKILINILVLILLAVISACASYKGDGKFEKKTSWLLFYPMHTYYITFESFDFSKGTVTFSFENVCSRNEISDFYLYITASKKMEWWNENTKVHLLLQNEKGLAVFEDSYQFNNRMQYDCHPEGGSMAFNNAIHRVPSEELILKLRVRQELGCDKYKLTLKIDGARSGVQITGNVRMLSSWYN